jgi:carbon-monoxide dehydrogenase small subunit
MKQVITLKVNGDFYSLAVEPSRNLNEVLREDLNLTGTKLGCGDGDCGACTVLVNGRSVSSCLTAPTAPAIADAVYDATGYRSRICP